MCDLRGAILSYANADKQKNKKRKHMLLVILYLLKYFFLKMNFLARINQ